MIKWLQNYLISWGQTEIQADIIARTLFCLVLLLAVWLVYLGFKGPVLRLLERLVVETTTKIKWDDVLLQEHFFIASSVFYRCCYSTRASPRY